MQWLFSLNGNFATTEKQARKQINQFIDIVGAKSMTVIYFRDKDLKVVDSYSNMVMYSSEIEANKALKKLIAAINETGHIQYVEFIRR